MWVLAFDFDQVFVPACTRRRGSFGEIHINGRKACTTNNKKRIHVVSLCVGDTMLKCIDELDLVIFVVIITPRDLTSHSITLNT